MPLTKQIDFAESRYVGEWFRHPVLGDPSFDSFCRLPGNPVHRGAPPLEWPVNGFLFHDPVSGNWYIYVGAYPDGYRDIDNHSVCILYRSTDEMQTWEFLGKVLEEGPSFFDHDGTCPGSMPDVTVVYDSGQYHMAYDWGRWAPGELRAVDGGIAYAVADRPEGPFRRAPEPIHGWASQELWLGRYRRLYAQTLIRRQSDWMILAMTDSAPESWALVGLVADEPEGPYSEPTFLRHVEQDRYHPPLMEFFPAYTYQGYVYAPTTSVALNRDYNMVFRAPIEEAMDPEAWEIYQDGSVWHSEPVENEAYGIWGQTYSGALSEGALYAMFPSRDQEGRGTINLAQRPWEEPLRQRGFAMGAHQGPAFTFVRRGYGAFALDAEVKLTGTGTLFWAYDGVLGPDAPRSDASLHQLVCSSFLGLEMGPNGWRVIEVSASGEETVHGQGERACQGAMTLRVAFDGEGATSLRCNGESLWEGDLPYARGKIGWLLEPHTHLDAERFVIEGTWHAGRWDLVCTEALLGAGEKPADWVTQHDDRFRHGLGTVHNGDGGRAKWNIIGTGFSVYAPHGPDYGVAEVILDGEVVGELDLRADELVPSAQVYSLGGLQEGPHAVVLRASEGPLVLDTLQVTRALDE